MSKLAFIASLGLFLSLTACMAPSGEPTSATTEALTDDGSQLVAGASTDDVAGASLDLVGGTTCLERLADDNDACTAAYNQCMAGATSWFDRAACVTRRAACMTEAAARFAGCIRRLTRPTAEPANPVPVTDPVPAGQAVPATRAARTSRLEDVLAPAWLGSAAPVECLRAS